MTLGSLDGDQTTWDLATVVSHPDCGSRLLADMTVAWTRVNTMRTKELEGFKV